MKLTDIRKVDRNDLPNQDFKDLYDQLKQESEDFNEDLLELFEDEVNEFLKFVKKFKPEAIKTQPVKKAPEKAPKEPVIEFDAPDVVKQVMEDYNLTQDKAERLIALRLEAIELKKENLDKLLDRLAQTEFYTGKLSKAPIDKGRTRDLGKDSKQGSITSAEERKMTKTPFKRISKAGRKNQFGTTEGGNVYYEYRMNRRDVDNKIKLATGGKLYGTGGGVLSTEEKIDQIIDRRFDMWDMEYWEEFGITQKDLDTLSAEKLNAKIIKAFGYVLNTNNKWSAEERQMELDQKVDSDYYDIFGDDEEEDYDDEDYDGDEYAKGGDIPNSDKMFHLPYELAVYVPSTQDVNKSITASELRARVKEVEKYLAETFGGFTSAEKVGGYLSSKSSIITEKVVPVTAFSSMQDFRANKSKLINKMSLWAKKWGQEAIGFEFEGDLYYVPQKFKTGGKLKATYIPRSDIKTLSTIWGNNIKGKDLLDGAYTTRKNIKTQPKVIRYFDGDEGYEYGEGGGVPTAKSIDIMESYREWVSDIRNQSYPRMSVSGAVKQASEYMLMRYSKAELIEAIKTDKQIDMFGMEKTWINALNKAKNPKMENGGAVHYKTGGEAGTKTLEDPKKLYNLLNEAEANWSKDGGAEYNRIFALIKENRKNYYNLLNQAEANWSKDGGAEYNRLLELQKDYYEKGGALVDTSVNFGYDKRVKGKRLASSGTQIELRQNTKSGEYCVFVDLYPIKETKTEYSEEAEQEYLFQIGFYEYRSGVRSTMPQKPKMVRSIIEEEEYEYFAVGGGIEHGFKVGDEILKIEGNLVVVLPKGSDKSSNKINYDIINVSNGKRINGIDYFSMPQANQRNWSK